LRPLLEDDFGGGGHLEHPFQLILYCVPFQALILQKWLLWSLVSLVIGFFGIFGYGFFGSGLQ
jgi:hypothetical protein